MMQETQVPDLPLSAFVAAIFLLLLLSSCSAPSPEPPVISRIEKLEIDAADKLGLVLPITIQSLDSMNCACVQGRLVDAENSWAKFCLYSEVMLLGAAGSGHWGVAHGECLPPMSQDRSSYLVNYEKQEALYTILAVWLVREFPAEDLQSIQEGRVHEEYDPDLSEKDEIAGYLLALSEKAESDTMRDIIAEGIS